MSLKSGGAMRIAIGISVALCIVLLDVGLVAAQPFHITFRREPDELSSLVLAGELANDGGRDVLDVWVGAEALNAEGKVVARGLVFVTATLRGRSSTPFTVKLPRVPEARAFRVAVSSFRYLHATESP
jgi:hypothetical protein